MKKLVSIIIPVYNREKKLFQAVKSCLAQTYKNIEIIIVNDGSTDNTNNLAKQLQKKYFNVKVINQHNQGVSKARINGLNQANGEYVMFLDSDDLISANYVSLLVETLERLNVSVVLARRYQKMRFFSILYNKYPSFMDLEKNKSFLPTFCGSVNCKLFVRESLQLKDFGLKANEDLAFIYYDLLNRRYISCNNEAIYIQRYSSDSLAKKFIYGDLRYIENTLKPLEIERQLFINNGVHLNYYEEIETIFIKNIFERIFNIYMSMMDKDKKLSLIACLIKYLNNYYPWWRKNKYLLNYFKGFSLDNKLYANIASLIVKKLETEKNLDYEETLTEFSKILKMKK